MKNRALLAAVTAACTAATANADPLPIPLTFSGYMRAGTGINVRGGTQVCAGLPGADTKWRLGNECDYVIEPNFNARIATYEDSTWHVHFMPSVYRAWGDREFQTYVTPGGPALTSGTDELVTRFGQAYAYGANIAALGHGKVWVGRRFYNRLQTGINDQFLENNDGDGAGIEEIDVFIGKLSVAAMFNPRGSATNNRLSLPIRLTGIQDLPNGELAVYVTPSMQLRMDEPADPLPPGEANAFAVGLYQTLKGVLFGGNTLIGAKMDWSGFSRNSRVVIQQSAFFGPVTLEGLAEYRINKSPNNGGNKWFGIGVRADTHIAGPFRVLVEAGHDVVNPDNDALHTRNMTKLTLATAVSPGPEASARPTVRLFVTHARWDEAARLSFDPNSRLAQVFGDKLWSTSVGLQSEAWW